jgi:tryptophan synthase alpha chain
LSDASKKLVIYLMAGPETPELAVAAVEGGADMIELGFPFSDPLAEGPIIREAAARALAAGMNTERCLACLAGVRERLGGDVSVIPMTYAAILEAYGYEPFERDAREAGASNFIIVDLPLDAHPELRRIRLVTPTSSDARIGRALALTDEWLYVVAVVGTTGVRDRVSPALAKLVGRTRSLGNGVPLYAGFGIATPAQARDTALLADGVVIGSRAVQVAREGTSALRDYVSSVRNALDTVA